MHITTHMHLAGVDKIQCCTCCTPKVFAVFELFSDSDEIYILLIDKRNYKPITFKAIKLIFILWWKNWKKIPIATIQNNLKHS